MLTPRVLFPFDLFTHFPQKEPWKKMFRYPLKLCCLFLMLSSLGITVCYAQTPAPALMQSFQLPLADSTTGDAQFLQGPAEVLYLVYSTPTGRLGLWTMTPSITPPTPEPTPTPTPPIPQKLTIAIVESPIETTVNQRRVLSDDVWRVPAARDHNFIGIIPSDVKEANTGEPPPALVPFLSRSSQHVLPWLMFYSATGQLLYECPLPETGKEIADLISKFGGTSNHVRY